MKKITAAEMNRVDIEQYKKLVKTPMIVVLDNIRSMNNIGSFFRTADAFRIEQLHLCGITACPPHREITKTALGSTESVDWRYFENTIDSIHWLKKNNYLVYAVEQVDTPIFLQDFAWNSTEKIALILGNEVFGVSDEILPLCNGAIEIPQIGTKHSLNVSVSAGMVMWHLHAQWLIQNKHKTV
jgi:tRNA G18 (ribose-2'-O)-methylase SpoU